MPSIDREGGDAAIFRNAVRKKVRRWRAFCRQADVVFEAERQSKRFT